MTTDQDQTPLREWEPESRERVTTWRDPNTVGTVTHCERYGHFADPYWRVSVRWDGGRVSRSPGTPISGPSAERERIRRNLSLPMLQALRLIPHGRVQQGCVISDGDVVRERLQAAYFAITDVAGAERVPLDLADVAPWMEMCGSCDAGLPQSCTCPPGDPRVVIAALVDEIVKQRQEAKR